MKKIESAVKIEDFFSILNDIRCKDIKQALTEYTSEKTLADDFEIHRKDSAYFSC